MFIALLQALNKAWAISLCFNFIRQSGEIRFRGPFWADDVVIFDFTEHVVLNGGWRPQRAHMIMVDEYGGRNRRFIRHLGLLVKHLFPSESPFEGLWI